ncbi:ABC transporter ATP-binding protein [Flexithrix dorotheae]|uniref:ABC transporter ATP-binding protein n=1 Tax=Flexithrix dorotheae TaxID=70993 RepID=UPI0003635D3D|nr:ABC transporter ATP-binding protein [Flexithrix dorotheae]
MIDLKEVVKIYQTDEVETFALNKLSLKIDQGEFTSIMGPSGCGKSTLLNIIGLIDMPTEGTYQFDGKIVNQFGEKQKADVRKENIGFVFQNFNLLDELPVYDNVELPLIYTSLSAKERKEKVLNVLSKLDIIHRKKHLPKQLSGGQQQRVAIARAIVNHPKILLADEPTGNLDSENGKEVMKILTDLNEEGTTIVMVTHSARDANYGSKIIHLFDGKMITENILKNLNYV